MKRASIRPRNTNTTSTRFTVFGDDKKNLSRHSKPLDSDETVAESMDQETRLIFVDSDSESTIAERAKRKRSTWVKAMHGKGLIHASKQFLKELPFKLWKSYIETFLIPRYRPEWGKYIKWDSKVPPITAEERKRKKKLNALRSVNTSTKSSKVSSQRSRALPPKRKHKRTKKRASDLPPRPVNHDHSDCVPIRINVAGQIFEPQVRTLKQFPNTLLGDPQRMIQYYDPVRDEFFFDRHRSSFEAILYYFNTGGIIRRPTTVPLEIFVDEVKFFDLGPEVLFTFQQPDGISNEDDRPLPKNLLKRKLWLLFEYPESSYQSRIVAYISILAVTISIFEFCIETLPEFSTEPASSQQNSALLLGNEDEDDEALYMGDPFFFTETICIIFFVLEYIVRAATSPHFFNFVKGISNLIDLIAIMPYFLTLLYFIDDSLSGNPVHNSDGQNKTISLTLFRVIRLVRVFRILKLSRHNRGLKILGKTLRASSRELGLLMFFLLVGVVVFSSAMFFAESQYENSPFTSIPRGFWFGVVTMTTLGYGDLVPVVDQRPFGKIIGSLCAIAGVLTISLPVPVIVSNFNMFYNTEQVSNPQAAQASKDVPECDHVEHCPYYPAWYSSDGQVVGDKMTMGKGSADNRTESYCARWLMGEQNPDFSDSDFDQLLKDEYLKRRTVSKTKKRSKGSQRKVGKADRKSTMTLKSKPTGKNTKLRSS